ncbi:hypothetical protein PRIC1_010856 [Phytophthora ramorum]
MALSLHPLAFRSGISSFPAPTSEVSLASAKVDATSPADAVAATHTKKSHGKPGWLTRVFRRNRVTDFPRQAGFCDDSDDSEDLIKSRLLFVNDARRTMEYAAYMQKHHRSDPYWTNTVRSSKYTALNFLPKSLFEQFRRVANFYFLIISLLQLCTDLSPTNEYSTIGPLMLVLTATMIKEGLEDRGRHQQDWIVNHGKTEALNGTLEGKKKEVAEARLGDFQTIFWKNLRVGHVVKLRDQDSLDGESNLKVRHCIKWNQITPQTPRDFADTVHGEIRCEAPNKRLYSFDGVMQISNATTQAAGEPASRQGRTHGVTSVSEEIPITIENVLLRGMKLCNTKWVVGVVVGGGNDTKLVQNMKAIPSKFSRLDRIANRCIFLIFSVLFGVCCFSSVQASLFAVKVHEKPGYARAFPFIGKFHPAYFLEAAAIENDPKMYCSITGRGVTARTSNVNEDLGQIKYIFSDKTGTLTKNQMLFKVCSIGGIIFDGSNMQLRRAAQASTDDLPGGSDMMLKFGSASAVRGSNAGRDGNTDGRRKSKHVSVTEKDVRSYSQMMKFVENPSRFSAKEIHAVELARPFFRCLLLCHSASVALEPGVSGDQSADTLSATGRRTESVEGSMRAESRRQSGGFNSFTSNHAAAAEASDAFPSLKGDRKFFGSSPDEVALLNAALEFDCVYERREGDVIHIRLFGKSESYQLLALNEFDSTRKCMSVVVKRLSRDEADQRSSDPKLPRVRDKQDILVFSKGADTVMFANANKNQDISKLALHVHYFAAMALRTLLLGYRTLSLTEYLEWKCEFDAAKKALSNREQLCVEVAKRIEKSVKLLGATGVEDLLQEGDKDETAISVAHMCGLIGPKSKIIIVKGKTKQDCLDEIAKARRKLKREGFWVPGVASQDISLVINGEALEFLLADALTSSAIKAQISYVNANQVIPHASITPHSDPTYHHSTTPDGLRSERDARLSGSMSSKSMGSLPFQSPNMALNSRHRSSSRPGSTRTSITDTNGGVQLAHELFLELASQCRTVVACRLSPMQKAQVVSLMKAAPGTPLTLAVGDGGNDVSMIQEAHVGIGIYGHEGMQAVRAADFAVVTFRDLSRLLLVHGRWNHRRVARVILFSFYKNMALIMTLFLYSFTTGTQDKPSNALFHSLLVFFFVTKTLGGVSSRYSRGNGLFPDGTAVYGALIITVTLKASIHMQCLHRWTRAHYISLFGGFVTYILFVGAYSQAYRMFPTFDVFRDFQGLAGILFSETLFWTLLFFTSVTCICVDLAIMYLRKMYLPSSNDIILEIDSGLGDLPVLPVRNADGSMDNSRASKLVYSSSGRSDEGSYTGGISAVGGVRARIRETHVVATRSRVVLCLKVMAFMIPLYAAYEVLWEHESSYIWIRVGYFVCDLLFMRFARTKFFVQNYQLSILLPYSIVGMALTLTISDTGKFAAALYPVGLFVVIRVKFLYALMLSLYNFAFYMLADRLPSLDYADAVSVSDLMLFALYLVFVITFGSYACYSLQITMRRDFLQSREDEQDVTILFCDIADFASFVNRFSPTEVVSLLDRVYSLFDQICQKHGVRKMETVGKTYMACAGLQGKDQGREAALRAVSMALDMLTCLDKCQASNGNGIKLRIGVHSGRVVSGLVGMKKQQFSLFGDTVNTASRMQSTGITGRCQISQVTYKKLAGYFAFEERQIDVKGKGSMTTYLVGEPLTEVAQMAVLGQLEFFSTKRLPRITRNKILHSARQRWKKYDPIRMLLGTPPDLASYGGTDASESVEQHMLTEIRLLNMCFKVEEMENKYLESTLSDRVEGARTTLLALAVYALFTCVRDLLVEIFSVLSTDAPQKEISPTMYAILLFIRSPFALVAILVARRVRDEFVFYSEIKLRNVLLGFYLVGLLVFTLAEALLWGVNFEADIDTSPRYVNLCLDTVLAMFVVSNGRSILYRHAVVFNVLALIMVSLTTLVSLQRYNQDAAKFNSKFKTSYPIVLTYFSVVANIIASQSVEFFTRRQIWLKTRTQLETMNADRLLYQMLPAAVVMRLKEGEMVSDQHQQVGILFSDIKGFTSIASQAATAQVVNILASLFCAFDKLTEKHGVFKMQTIGDAYVIVSGLPYVDMSLGPGLVTSSASTADMSNADASMSVASVSAGGLGTTVGRLSSNRVLPLERKSEVVEGPGGTPRGSGTKLRSHLLRRSTLKHKHQMHLRSHIRDLLAMARDMHKEVRKVQDPNTGERLQMRIGIHIGNIIGGVIGTTTLRYDMWGPDALTANELESNGVPEKIS